MVALANARFEPVWINVRTTAVPSDAGIVAGTDDIELNSDRTVPAGFHKGFFVRSLVLSPGGGRLLNAQSRERPMETFHERGHFPYGQVKVEDYLPMLDGALARR